MLILILILFVVVVVIFPFLLLFRLKRTHFAVLWIQVKIHTVSSSNQAIAWCWAGYSVSKKSIEQHEMLNLKRKKSSKLYRNQVFIVIVEGQHIFCKNRNCIVGMWKHLGVIITHMQSFMTWVSIPRFDLIVKWCNNCTQHWTLQFLS